MNKKTSTFSRSDSQRAWQNGPVILKNIQKHFSRSWRNLAKKDNEFQRETVKSLKTAIWQSLF